jgi:hypothetical protein
MAEMEGIPEESYNAQNTPNMTQNQTPQSSHMGEAHTGVPPSWAKDFYDEMYANVQRQVLQGQQEVLRTIQSYGMVPYPQSSNNLPPAATITTSSEDAYKRYKTPDPELFKGLRSAYKAWRTHIFLKIGSDFQGATEL